MKTSRRQQMNTPVNAKTAGISPKKLQSARVTAEPAEMHFSQPKKATVGKTVGGIEDKKDIERAREGEIDPRDSPD